VHHFVDQGSLEVEPRPIASLNVIAKVVGLTPARVSQIVGEDQPERPSTARQERR
jgi:hypothetical protein